MNRSDQWHVEGWFAWLLAPFLIIFILVANIFMKIFGISFSGKERTPKEVAGYIRDFIENTGGDWDWDDFTSISIKDPRLEAIRLDASRVFLPGGPEQIEELKQLLARAEAIHLEDWRERVAAHSRDKEQN